VLVHGGLERIPPARVRAISLGTFASRFLAAGYVVTTITYRSRDVDPQSKVSLEDTLAAIEHHRGLSYVDRNSIVVIGCSGGGDLALAAAAETDLAAIVSEEPASILFTGVFNKQSPKKGARFTPFDAAPILADPKRYYTPECQKLTREKIARIRCPILIIQGDPSKLVNPFNNEILIPELRAAGKTVEVFTYKGEPHCFAFFSAPPFTPRPAVALKAFEDIDAYLRIQLKTKAVPIDPSLVKHVPVETK
jgi:dienelactone hydrolase